MLFDIPEMAVLNPILDPVPIFLQSIQLSGIALFIVGRIIPGYGQDFTTLNIGLSRYEAISMPDRIETARRAANEMLQQ
jgi:hypothetical protein